LGQSCFSCRHNSRKIAAGAKDFSSSCLRAGATPLNFAIPEDDILDLLRNNDIALSISDHHDAPSPWLATASFVYVRGHGPGGRYRGHYRSDTLARWKRWLLAMRRAGRTVYVYFDNDQKGAAPKDAAQLQAMFQAVSRQG
jgi:uncharacterized protein YecE (DUF72 family)